MTVVTTRDAWSPCPCPLPFPAVVFNGPAGTAASLPTHVSHSLLICVGFSRRWSRSTTRAVSPATSGAPPPAVLCVLAALRENAVHSSMGGLSPAVRVRRLRRFARRVVSALKAGLAQSRKDAKAYCEAMAAPVIALAGSPPGRAVNVPLCPL